MNISVIKDVNTTDHQTMFSAYVIDKYKLVFEGLKIKYKDSDLVVNKILEEYPTAKKQNFPLTMFYEYNIIEHKDFFITMDSYDNKKKIIINYYFNSYEESRKIFDIIKSFEDKDEDLYIDIWSLFLSPNKNIEIHPSIKLLEDYKFNSESYYPYLDTKELFDQYRLSDSNILVFCGTTGIGKSKLADSYMKYLLEEKHISSHKKEESIITDDDDLITTIKEYGGVKVAYIKNEEMLSLDALWNLLQEEEYDLVFLDDLDYALLPRNRTVTSGTELDKNKFISQLLSFTDGIFEAGNRTKFIITTNRSIEDIDTAVLRKGRTFDILQLRDLSIEEAKVIWVENDLDIKDFNFPGPRVLQADLGSLISTTLKANAKNIKLKPYIKEPGISLYQKIKNPKKIGI